MPQVRSKRFQFYLTSLLCLSPFISSELYATTGTWRGGIATQTWTVPTNWETNGTGTYPGVNPGGGDVARFIAPPRMTTTGITSTSIPLTLGRIDFNLNFPGDPPKTLDFNLTSVTFLQPASLGGIAQIVLTSGIPNFRQTGPGFSGSNAFILSSPLVVQVPRDSQPGQTGMTIANNMSGPFGATFNLQPNVGVSLTGQNTVPISVSNGILTLARAGAGGQVIQSSATVNPGGTLRVASGAGGSNQFSTSATVTLNQGTLDLGGSSAQAFDSLTIYHGGTAIGGGNFGPVATLTLFNDTTALSMKEGTFLVPNLVLRNGGAIVYDPTLPGSGSAIIGAEDHVTSIDLGGKDVTLAVGSGSTSIGRHFDLELFDVDVSNGSLTKTQPGTLVFAGNNVVSSFALNGGIVVIGRTAGEFTTLGNSVFTVNAGTRLEGFGTLNSTSPSFTVHNSGIVEPGDAAQLGMLTIQGGSYIQEPGGTLFIRAINRSVSSLVVTGGGVNLNGTLMVTGTGVNFQNGDRVVILDNTQGTGITGTFARFVENITNDLLAKYVVLPNQVVLEFFPSPEPEIGAGETAQITLVEGHTLNVLSRLRAVRTRSDGYLVSQPEYQTEADHPKKTITLRKSRNLDYKPLATAETQEQITAGKFWKKPFDTPASVYVAPLGSWGRVSKINVQEGYKFDSVGGLIGADYAFDRVGAGLLLGYEGLHGSVEDSFGTFRLKSAFGELYGTFLPLKNRNLFIDLILGGSRNWYTFNRQSSCFVATGTPKGWEYDAYAGLGYDFNIKKEWRFTPIFGFQYINTSINAFTEDGAFDENLEVGSQRMHSSRTWLGASFGGKLNRNKIIWMPEVRGYWQHEFAPLSHCLTVNSPCFCFCENLRIFTGERNYGDLGAELRVLFGQHYNWSLAGAYDYFWSRSSHTNYLYGELGYNF
jgi:hypothetical protein